MLNSIQRIRSLLKDDVHYYEEGNILHFIVDENDRP